MERKANEQNAERPRVIPFIRKELSRSEGIRIENGERTFSFRPVNEKLVQIKEKIGEEEKHPEIIELEEGVTYQHEITEGKVISITGGKIGLAGRKFVLNVPAESEVKKVRYVLPGKK